MRITWKLLLGHLVLTSLTCFVGWRCLSAARRELERNVEAECRLLAFDAMRDLDRLVQEEIEDWSIYAKSPAVQRAVAASNAAFARRPRVEAEIDREDAVWRAAHPESPSSLCRDLLKNRLSRDLQIRLGALRDAAGNQVFGEAFITNRHGAVVALTNRTSDYRQDDEEWWRVARERGTCVTDIEFDESAGHRSVALCVRIVDDAGRFCGILKAVLDAGELTALLEEHVRAPGSPEQDAFVLVGRGGTVIYRTEGAPKVPLSISDLSTGAFAHRVVTADGEEMLASVARSQMPELIAPAATVVSLVRADEVVAPVSRMWRDLLMTFVAFVVVVLIVGSVFLWRLSGRIRVLRRGSRRLADGDLSVRVDDRHTDELGHFGRVFNLMAASLEKARDASQAADRAKSEFLSNMSHELRTPIAAVLGHLDEVIEDDVCRERAGEHLSRADHAARRLLHLVEDLFTVSEIDREVISLELAPCRVREAIREVVDRWRSAAEEAGLELECRFADAVPEMIEVDRRRLQRVITTLVSNAVAFTESGSVRVSGRIEDAAAGAAALVVDVVDTGAGMSEADLEVAFDLFGQADASRTRSHEGAGLGLAIAAHLIKAMGGRLEVSTAPGEGSTFRVAIPVKVGSPGVSPPPAGHSEDEPLAGRSILVAEDNKVNQMIIAKVLRGAGATLQMANDGAEAVEIALSHERFDAVVLDLMMPVLDGFGAAAELRKRGVAAPIIALTADARVETQEQCLSGDFDAFETKPVDAPTLVATIDRCMRTVHSPSPA